MLAARIALRNWGATKTECRKALPGDEFVPDPAAIITRAVTVKTPAEEVWHWLVQIGQDRGGMYSYEVLENAFGLDLHNADEIRPEWQHLAVGDQVRLERRGWLVDANCTDLIRAPISRWPRIVQAWPSTVRPGARSGWARRHYDWPAREELDEAGRILAGRGRQWSRAGCDRLAPTMPGVERPQSAEPGMDGGSDATWPRPAPTRRRVPLDRRDDPAQRPSFTGSRIP